MTENPVQAAATAAETAVKTDVKADEAKVSAAVTADVSKVEAEAESLWTKVKPYALLAGGIAAGFLVGKIV